MDVLEIALDSYTDFKKFERLALEVLSLEGFKTIKPIGGVSDQGIDAEDSKFFEDKEQMVVFQFTLQESLPSKISGTIRKLKENNINFHQLIIATKHRINNIQEYKRKAREKHKVGLEIYDRELFIKHLSSRQDIFNRYFPDIKSQLNSKLFDKQTIFSKNSDNPLSESLLKCSLLFTFNPKAESTRKDLFDSSILALIVNEKELTKGQIKDNFENKFNCDLQLAELDAVLGRLKKLSLVSINNDLVKATPAAIVNIESNIININEKTQALIYDIISGIQDTVDEPLSNYNQTIITENIKLTLSAYFRLFGLEYSVNNKPNGFKESFTSNLDLISLAKNNLPEKIGDALIYNLGEIIKSPTSDQASVLANWAKAFIGLQIMGLDPKLRSIQTSKLKSKSFIFDTDFLLYVLVDEIPQNKIYRRILNSLIEIGCRIIIPTEVIKEALKHAEFSIRSYNYFKNTFDTVDKEIVEEKLGNVYVRGYYSGVIDGTIDKYISFKTYLENYYDREQPFAYLIDVIKSKLPKSIEIKEISDLTIEPLKAEKLQGLTNEILQETEKTQKAGYRSADENFEIANTDAKLFLTTYELNLKKSNVGTEDILKGNFFLLTTSIRASKCAKKLGYSANVIAKPNTISNLLERIGALNISAKEFINLFDNPFLAEAASNSWDSIKTLVDAGASLRGKNIVRLKWDLDKEINNFIKDFNDTDIDNKDKTDNTELYINFMKTLKGKGLTLIPEVEEVINKVDKLKVEVEVMQEDKNKIEEKLKEFGRKKRRYIEKIRRK